MAKKAATVKVQPRYINRSLHELIVPIDSVHLDEDNPQKHGEASIVDITNSLKEFGQRKPIVINQKTNIVIAGNGVLEAARSLGWEYIAASFQTFKNKQHERAFAIVDNLAPRNAEWDVAHLAPVLTDADMLSNEQFGSMLDDLRKELKIVKSHQRDAGDEEIKDEKALIRRAHDLQKKWKCKTGQTWEVTRERTHRLICDDNANVETNNDDVLIVTDPPYDMPARQVIDTIERFGRTAVIMGSDKQCSAYASYWNLSMYFVWRHKPRSVVTRKSIPLTRHTLIAIVEQEKQNTWKRHRPDVESMVFGEYDVTTWGQAKPPEIFEFISGFSHTHVVDPFAGSGSTIVAADMYRKTAQAIEREPHICAVALERAVTAGFQVALA